MVFASLDFEISEPELRNLCECDENGTVPTNAVEAAIYCGFDAYKSELNFDELKEVVSQNITPIVFIKVSDSVTYTHAVVVYKISNGKIHVIDPENQEREFDSDWFIENWSRGLALIIEKKSI